MVCSLRALRGSYLPIKSQVHNIAQVVFTGTLTQGESQQTILMGRSALSQGLRANRIGFINPGSSSHYRKPLVALVGGVVYALQHSKLIKSRCFSTSMSQSLHKSKSLATESGSSNGAPVIISLPHKLPMIVKPKLDLYKDSTSTPYSAVQHCSH